MRIPLTLLTLPLLLSTGCDDVEPPSMAAMPNRPSKVAKPIEKASAASQIAKVQCPAEFEKALDSILPTTLPVPNLFASKAKGTRMPITLDQKLVGIGNSKYSASETHATLLLAKQTPLKDFTTFATKAKDKKLRIVFEGTTNMPSNNSEWAQTKIGAANLLKGNARWASLKSSMEIAAGTCVAFTNTLAKLENSSKSFIENKQELSASAKACNCQGSDNLSAIIREAYHKASYSYIDINAVSDTCLASLDKADDILVALQSCN